MKLPSMQVGWCVMVEQKRSLNSSSGGEVIWDVGSSLGQYTWVC